MNSNKGIIVQIVKNKNNNMYYKAVMNSVLYMWSPRVKKWIKPCTTYKDMMDSIDNYDAINDREAEYLAQAVFK